MIELQIEGLKDLQKFLDEDFESRILAVQKYILRTVVQDIYEAVEKAIPDKEHWLKVYKRSLKVYELDEMPEGEFGYAIASRVSGDWSMVDGANMIVYFDALPATPDSKIGEVLEQYSPFSVDQVPNLDDYGARAVIRRVRAGEVEDVRKINEKRRSEFIEALAEQGVSPNPGPAVIKGHIYFDMQFMVMRMEMGLGEIRKPHWRPALRKVGIFLDQAAKSCEVHKTMAEYFAPSEVAWQGEFRKSHSTMRLVEVEKFEQFQKRVFPRVI